MFAIKVNISLFRSKAVTAESLLKTHVKYYNRKIDTVAKRGSILNEFIANKDKRKKWHFNIMPDKPKARSFEKIHKPHRRRAVLNTLFIHNITDVLSTADIAPELSQYSIEITGVRIAPCYKILNVFWQVPVNQHESCEDIAKTLTLAAPKIRAELISRNVLGRIPYIFFLRDGTNEKISAFEKAMQNLDLGPDSDSNIIVDDSFLKDILLFKSSKDAKKKTEVLTSDDSTSDDITSDDRKESDEDVTKEEHNAVPERPADMKNDIYGLNHDIMMEKVMALKKKKPPISTALISPDSLKDGDLFDKIPGIHFETDSSSRDDVLKKFQIQRKMLMKEKKEMSSNNNHECYEDFEDADDAEYDTYEEDFIDDEVTDKSRH